MTKSVTLGKYSPMLAASRDAFREFTTIQKRSIHMPASTPRATAAITQRLVRRERSQNNWGSATFPATMTMMNTAFTGFLPGNGSGEPPFRMAARCSHTYTRLRASTNRELKSRMAGVTARRTPLPAIRRLTPSRIS